MSFWLARKDGANEGYARFSRGVNTSAPGSSTRLHTMTPHPQNFQLAHDNVEISP